jgi:hypothetical protein
MARMMNPADIVFTITVEPEDTAPSEGGLPDEEIVAHIEKEMEWNEWAWCVVKVTAKWGGFEGTNYLGQCSYKDEADFAKGGYLPQMREEAAHELKANIKAAGWDVAKARTDYEDE